MSQMIFLSEYTNKNRVAHLFQRVEQRDYVVVQHLGVTTTESEPFALESDAENFAQDWIMATDQTQPASDSAGCCDRS
jgi:hypothetical protein